MPDSSGPINKDERISVRLNTTDTIAKLKEKIEEKTGITPKEQRLLFLGAWIKDDSVTLDSLTIQEGTTLHLVRGVNGGSS